MIFFGGIKLLGVCIKMLIICSNDIFLLNNYIDSEYGLFENFLKYIWIFECNI